VAGNIAALTITAAEIASGAITTAKILAANVTATELAAGSVIAGKIAAGAIVAADIAAGTITGAKIAALTIEAANIAAGAITTAKIAALAVTAAEIAANTITAAKIAAGTITTTQIAAATIVAGNIVAGTITGNEIAASTITSGKLSVAQLSAISADLGTVTAGSIVVGTTNKLWLNDAADGALSIGGAVKASAPFRVAADGTLIATSATITGTITSTSGTIGGFTLSSTALYAGTVATRIQLDTGVGIWLGATAFADAPFRVSLAGALVATSATITGTITSTSGTIGGFTLSSTALYAGTVATRIQLDTTAGIHLGATAFADAPFRVSLAGVLTATGANIRGTLNADDITAGTLNVDRINANTIAATKLILSSWKTREQVPSQLKCRRHLATLSADTDYLVGTIVTTADQLKIRAVIEIADSGTAGSTIRVKVGVLSYDFTNCQFNTTREYTFAVNASTSYACYTRSVTSVMVHAASFLVQSVSDNFV